MADMSVPQSLEDALARMPESEREKVRRLWAYGALMLAPHADVIPGLGVSHVLVVAQDQPPRLVRKRVLL
ncbi:MAG TPA: hypothetical protein VMU12_03360 [Candidatus Paceibacterota bacterium]|nr:hypothetical protein [Candidatus Paceibacterota bacterium]